MRTVLTHSLNTCQQYAWYSYHTLSELADTLYARFINAMYEIKLIYDPEPRTLTLRESITYCATIDLFVQHGIESFQTSASRIAFESDRDRVLALLLLSESKSFTPVCVN